MTNKLKVLLTVALAVMLSMGAVFAVSMSVDEMLQIQGVQEVSNVGEVSLGGTYAPMIVGLRNVTKTIAPTSIYATTTLQTKQSGTTFILSASGTSIILPAVSASEGVNFKFTVGAATLSDGNVIVTSAEGDNIEGTLIVAGAVVDCDAVDQINFVVDGENIGDYVEIYSDGEQWLIGDSGVLTATKMTCTDPA